VVVSRGWCFGRPCGRSGRTPGGSDQRQRQGTERRGGGKEDGRPRAGVAPAELRP
jgi:hypothetical protein